MSDEHRRTAFGGLKRKSKHSPQERSSKIPPSKARNIVGPNITKPERRDPRFEKTSGNFNQDLFERSYGFVYGYQSDEIRSLEKKIKETKERDVVDELKIELQSKKNRVNSRKQKQRRREILREWRKSERELVKNGKKPYFLKKSDLKKIEMVEKYKEIVSKGSSHINKYIENKNKKRASASKKSCPVMS